MFAFFYRSFILLKHNCVCYLVFTMGSSCDGALNRYTYPSDYVWGLFDPVQCFKSLKSQFFFIWILNNFFDPL